MEWSYSGLLSTDKELFQRLAVFSGSWTMNAAEDICSDSLEDMGSALPASEVAPGIIRLVDKSLVQVESREHQARYRLLEPVLQFAGDLLEKGGDAERYQQMSSMQS